MNKEFSYYRDSPRGRLRVKTNLAKKFLEGHNPYKH